MSEEFVQEQIKEINRKLDLILEENEVQRQNREAIKDLIDDVAFIGNDAFKNLVKELDHATIELDTEALKCLSLRLVRNIRSLGMVMEALESLSDLLKDISPIIKQIGLDGAQKFYELEQKGYFEILSQVGKAIDTIMSRYKTEDFQNLSDNLVLFADTLTNISDPRLLNKLNIAVSALKNIDPENIKEYSVWGLLRQMNKPEVRKSIGFIMAFLNNIINTEDKQNN